MTKIYRNWLGTFKGLPDHVTFLVDMVDGRPMVMLENDTGLSDDDRAAIQRELDAINASGERSRQFLAHMRAYIRLNLYEKISIGIALAILAIAAWPLCIYWWNGHIWLGDPKFMPLWSQPLLSGAIASGVVLMAGFWPRHRGGGRANRN